MIEHEGVTCCEPGDDHLSMDVSGCRIQTWTEINRSFVVTLAGGCGWWLDENGDQLDIEHVESVEVQVACADDDTALSFRARLNRWHRDGLMIGLAASRVPGRLGWIGAGPDDCYPLPTQGFPSDVES